MGPVGQSVPPVSTTLAVRFASNAPTLAYALSAAAFNLGIAIGSLIAGIALDSSLGLTGPALVGMIMVALGLIPLLGLTAIRATRTDPPSALEPSQPQLTEKADLGTVRRSA